MSFAKEHINLQCAQDFARDWIAFCPETPCSEKLPPRSLKLFTLCCLIGKDGSPHCGSWSSSSSHLWPIGDPA